MKAIPCEVYSRIVGYFSPVRNWNKGKQVEYAERRVYDTPPAGDVDREARLSWTERSVDDGKVRG